MQVFNVETSAELVNTALKAEKASTKPPKTDVFVEAKRNRKPLSLNLIYALYFSYSINILAVIISCMSLPV